MIFFEKRTDLFSYSKKNKKFFFNNSIFKLVNFHYNNCVNYKKILLGLKYKLNNKKISNIPALPVSLFKKFNLHSVKINKIIKILKSSGTSGSEPSKIFLDSFNAKNQIWVLSKIVESIIGKKRLPMLIVDKDPKGVNRSTYNARIAAINGFSIFGKSVTYLLNKNNKVDFKKLNYFLNKFGNEKFLIFGFTNLIFEHFLESKLKILNSMNLKNGIIIHGGGWKKLERKAISNKIFKKNLKLNYNISKIFNYYGLIEQTGSIFIECHECSCFKCSIYSDIFIRDKNLNIIKKNKQRGFLQVLSLLPTSYPGNSLLTEDIAELRNDIKCKSCGESKKFVIHGRSKNSEIRGCANI